MCGHPRLHRTGGGWFGGQYTDLRTPCKLLGPQDNRGRIVGLPALHLLLRAPPIEEPLELQDALTVEAVVRTLVMVAERVLDCMVIADAERNLPRGPD